MTDKEEKTAARLDDAQRRLRLVQSAPRMLSEAEILEDELFDPPTAAERARTAQFAALWKKHGV